MRKGGCFYENAGEAVELRFGRPVEKCVKMCSACNLSANLCIDRYFCLFMSIINIKNCSGNAVCNLGRSKILKKLCYRSTEIKLVFWALLGCILNGNFALWLVGFCSLRRPVLHCLQAVEKMSPMPICPKTVCYSAECASVVPHEMKVKRNPLHKKYGMLPLPHTWNLSDYGVSPRSYLTSDRTRNQKPSRSVRLLPMVIKQKHLIWSRSHMVGFV